MSDEPVVERLRDLGLSSYEARAYVALLRSGEPLNGYEVAKRAGMPRSMVYETLGKLVARGAAYEVRDSKDSGSSYVPLPGSALLDRMNRSFQDSVEGVRSLLGSLTPPQEVHLVHTLNSGLDVLTRAEDIVADARRELFVSAWREELEQLKPSLEAAENAGVSVFVLAYDTGVKASRHTYVHEVSSPEVVLESYGRRLFIAVADQVQAVIGGFVGDSALGIYTDDTAVVSLAVEYITHDIAIQRLAEHIGHEEMDKFWYSDPELLRMRQSLSGQHGATVRKILRPANANDATSSAAAPAQKKRSRQA